MAELNDFIPGLDIVTFQIDELEEAEVIPRHLVHAANLVAIVSHEVELLDVWEDRS